MDSNGQNNTVDTGNTNSIFLEGLYYICNAASTGANFNEVTETYTSSSSGTNKSYMDIKILKTCYLNSVAKTSTCTATRFLLTLGGTTLETINFSGNNAVLPAERILTAGNTYRFIVDNAGACYTSHYVGSTSSFPITYTYTQITAAETKGTSRTNNLDIINLKQIGTTYSDATLQSVATTIPSGMTKVFVTPLMYEALSTGDNITVDVSCNNVVTNTTLVNGNTTTSATTISGMKYTALNSCLLTRVIKETNCTATKCYLKDSALNTLASATFSGNNADISYNIVQGTTYYIVVDKDGASYNRYWNNGALNTTNLNNFKPIASYSGGADGNNFENINNIYTANTTTGDFTEDIPLNEWTEITTASTGGLVVKANLNTNDGSTTPKVSGWRVLLE